jgi:hypothetical protein
MSKTEIDSPISPNFFKPFKNLDEFNSFFITFFKQEEEMLKVELEKHLGYQKHDPSGYNTGNTIGLIQQNLLLLFGSMFYLI